MRPLATLRLVKTIFHEVPQARRGDDDPAPLRLSTAPVELDDSHRHYMQDRLKRALHSARDVLESTEYASIFPAELKTYFGSEERELVATSQKLASRLREVQTGASNAGLLMVAEAKWGHDVAFIVAKIELERGVRAEPTETADGQVTYSVQLLEDLVFGETSRILKVGLFSKGDVLEDGRISGFAVDRQGSQGVAGFFLYEYLGCEYSRRPEVVTQDFFDDAQTWIGSLKDSEKQARYEVALLAEMNSNSGEVIPSRFARESLEEADRDAFLGALTERVPRNGFPKATTLIPIKRVRIDTERGAQVLADPRLIEERVVQISQDGVSINDPVISLGGHGKQRRRSSSSAEASEEGPNDDNLE